MCDEKSADVRLWLNSVQQNIDLFDCQVNIEGRTNQGDGYGSDIHFIKVTGRTKEGSEKNLRLAVKSSFRENKMAVSIAKAFLKEIYIYDLVRTEFENLLAENGINEEITLLTRCYATYSSDEYQFLVFENLRYQNFELWDKTVPMPHKHTELILEAYGQWHAFSMALKTRKPEVFEELIKNQENLYGLFISQIKFDEVMWEGFEKSRELAFGEDEQNYLKHLQYSLKDVRYAISDMYSEDTEYQVISHSDCWTNNYLFKCNDDKSNPSEVRVLDWQCSCIAPPVFDLSHFIYCCVDTEKYQNNNDLLKIYYASFSRCLNMLGCNPEEVFSFQKLMEQWKKFSHYGLFVTSYGLRGCLGDSSGEGLPMAPADHKEFVRRMRNNFLHYCKHIE